MLDAGVVLPRRERDVLDGDVIEEVDERLASAFDPPKGRDGGLRRWRRRWRSDPRRQEAGESCGLRPGRMPFSQGGR
jgi:hypothetical protein